ncbi:MAG: hypothetical protein FWE51_04695 [Coriobacteriia bacterium]|nr:hypothetical protein [Coriobacteriia bacterium]
MKTKLTFNNQQLRAGTTIALFFLMAALLAIFVVGPASLGGAADDGQVTAAASAAATAEDELESQLSLEETTDVTLEDGIGSITEEGHNQIILLLAPFLQWEDISPEKTPQLWADLEDAAIGNLNARSRVKEADGAPSLAEGALTISAGTWALVSHAALPAFEADDLVNGTPVSLAYGRYLDGSMEGYQIAYLGLPRNMTANNRNPFTFIPGTLGSLIEEAGGATVALGNSDLGHSTDASRLLRPAAIAAMNEKGFVRYGNINETVLTRSPDSPFGVRTDLDSMREGLIDAQSNLPAGKPGLVVIDPGDSYRARIFSPEASAEVSQRQWDESLTTLDTLYGDAKDIFPDATIIVASQATRSLSLNREGFGPIVITGPEVEPGLLMSDSTHRQGLVIAGDITTTILRIMGLDIPVNVVGCDMYVTDNLPPLYSPPDRALYQSSLAERRDVHLDLLVKMSDTAMSIEATRVSVITTCIWITVIVLFAGALVVTFANKYLSRMLTRIVKMILYALILAVLSGPVASWLMFLIYRWPATPQEAITQFALTTFGLWLVAVALWIFDTRRKNAARISRLPIIFLSVFTTLVIVIDQLLGAPASFASFFGYSPIAAFRFYGIGNEGAAILIGSVFVAIALILDYARESGKLALEKHLRIWGIPLIGVIITFVGAAPVLGASNGFTPFSVTGFAVMWILANNRKIDWKAIGGILVTIAVFVFFFMAIDRFTAGQTHMIRAVDSAAQGGLIEIWNIIVRKAQTSLRVFNASTQFSLSFAAVLAYLIYMRVRPAGDFKNLIAGNKYYGDAIAAVLAAGVAAVLSNDSGIVLPALMVLCLASSIVWLMLGPVRGKAAASEDDDAAGTKALRAGDS